MKEINSLRLNIFGWRRADFLLVVFLIFYREGSFQGKNLSREILYWGNFPWYLYTIFLNVFFYLSSLSISHVELLRVIVQSRFSMELNFLEGVFVGREISP